MMMRLIRPTILEGVLYLYCVYKAQISFLESLLWAAGRHFTSAPYICVAHSRGPIAYWDGTFRVVFPLIFGSGLLA